MSRLIRLTAVAVALLVVSIGQGHPGRTDANGGHNDRKSGGYHYHSGPRAATPATPSPAPVRTYTPAPAITTPRTVERPKPVVAERTVTTKPASERGKIEVFFSPNGGCTEAIIKEIDSAKERVLIQAYSFTSAPIAKAIIEAKKRGVEVVALLDKSNKTDRYSSATFLKNQGSLSHNLLQKK